MEGGIGGLVVDSRPETAKARAVHHREAGAVDGRGRGRSRRHRADDGKPGLLGCRPEPVGGAVRGPSFDPHAEHPRLLFPAHVIDNQRELGVAFRDADDVRRPTIDQEPSD